MAGLISSVTKTLKPTKPLEEDQALAVPKLTTGLTAQNTGAVAPVAPKVGDAKLGLDNGYGGVDPFDYALGERGGAVQQNVTGNPNTFNPETTPGGNNYVPPAPAVGEAGAYAPGGTGQPAMVGTPAATGSGGGIISSATQNASGGAWEPASGLDTDMKGIDPTTVTAGGYKPVDAPAAEKATATGYTAEGYIADQVEENLSQATNRIIGEDSPLMQRERANAAGAANARGLLNSSMAIQAGEAAVMDRAIQIGQGDVDVSKFNVGQNNDAMRFSADAKNAASAFLANAQNMASQFNAGESNKLGMFAAEQANMALRFAADAENAAKTFNAQAFNEAKQRYADAVNSAKAAMFDAVNQSRRDAAQFEQQTKIEKMGNEAQLGAASISAGATLGSARIRAESDAEGRVWQSGENATAREENRAFTRETLGAAAYESYAARAAAIDRADLTPEARAAAHANNDAISQGYPYFPATISTKSFPGGN